MPCTTESNLILFSSLLLLTASQLIGHPFLEPAGCGLSGSGGLCREQKPCGEGEGDLLALGGPRVSLLVLMLVPIFKLMERTVGEPVSRRWEALGRGGQVPCSSRQLLCV